MATWTIANLERNLGDGGVFVAHWRVSSTEGDYSASAYGTCSFSYDPTDPSFVPYDSLTEEVVLGWVWGEVDQAATEAALAADIEAQQHPTTADGVPW
jgi:hypothetical protein